MNALAEALTRSLTASTRHLVVLNTERAEWTRHPWTEVHARGLAVADRLLEQPDGAVGLVGEPTVEFVAGIHGSWLAGRAISILPGPVRGADIDQWAQSTLSRFTGIGVTTVLSHGATLAPLREHPTAAAVLDVTALAQPGSATPDLPATATGGVLQGTAGSTGTPRTAVLSPEAVLANITGLLQHTRVDGATEVGLSWLPLYHDMGLSFLLSGALSGSDMWLAPTSAFAASPFRWLNWLSEARATMTAAPNFAYNVLGKYGRRVSGIDLSALRFALNGGEPIDCDGFAAFLTEMARFGLDSGAASPSYGLAETTCAVTTPIPGEGLRYDEILDPATGSARKHAVLGAPIPGMELRLAPVEQEQFGLPGREVGQVEIRGASMMSGYLGQDPLTPGTWFPTGDLGYLSDGGLVVCGRVKELITVAGRNIFPTEVEAVAAQVRGVREGAVAAVGADGLRQGLIITAEFRGPDEAGARGELVQRVASECGIVPADVVFVAPGTLPRTSSGKLRRLQVKQELEQARS